MKEENFNNNSNNIDSIIEKVKKTIADHRMLGKGDSVLISLSGGPDSIFLTHILVYLKNQYELKLHCFHLDHKTREGQSTRDAVFVAEICKKMGIHLFKKTIDAGQWCREHNVSFQEGSRSLRLKFLKDIANKNDIKKIAVGHTADDSMETFFMNLLRGSGTKGLCGISPVDEMIIRPLIACHRYEIENYLNKKEIVYCIDKTNLENVYFRNRIRNLLLPYIRKNIKTGFENNLLNTMDILREEDELISTSARAFLHDEAEYLYNDLENKSAIRSIKIPVEKLADNINALNRRIFIEAIRILKGSTTDIKSVYLNKALKFLFKGGESKSLSVADGIKIKKEFMSIIICKDTVNKDIKSKTKRINSYPLNIGSEINIKEFGLKVFSKILDKSELKKEELKNVIKTDFEAFLDYDRISPPVLIRRWQPDKGEKFIPFGMVNFKKLHDFFIDKKVPLSARSKIPVFFDEKKIIWVGKLRIDNRVRIDYKTKKILYIKIVED